VSPEVKPEEAFDQYHQAVFRFAYRMTRRADLAADIAQECFLALLRAPRRFDWQAGRDGLDRSSGPGTLYPLAPAARRLRKIGSHPR
jgi:hypothetical protein